MLDLLRLLEKLNSPRRGWVKRGIPDTDVETISGHMYQMAMILIAYPHWVR
jgi:5'-deoxynucleotidase YfbR-like HD superfamily hydrolase